MMAQYLHYQYTKIKKGTVKSAVATTLWVEDAVYPYYLVSVSDDKSVQNSTTLSELSNLTE